MPDIWEEAAAALNPKAGPAPLTPSGDIWAEASNALAANTPAKPTTIPLGTRSDLTPVQKPLNPGEGEMVPAPTRGGFIEDAAYHATKAFDQIQHGGPAAVDTSWISELLSTIGSEVGITVAGVPSMAGRGIANTVRGGAGLVGQALETKAEIQRKLGIATPQSEALGEYGYSLRQEAANGLVADVVNDKRFSDPLTPKTRIAQIAQSVLAAPIEFAPYAIGGPASLASLAPGATMALHSGLQAANTANQETPEGDYRFPRMAAATGIGAAAGYTAGRLMPGTQPVSRAFTGFPWRESSTISTRTALSAWLGEAASKSVAGAGVLTVGQFAEKAVTGGKRPDLSDSFIDNLASQVGFTVVHGATRVKDGMRSWEVNDDGSLTFTAEGKSPTDAGPFHARMTAKIGEDGLVRVAVPVPGKPGMAAWVPVDDIHSQGQRGTEGGATLGVDTTGKAFEAAAPEAPSAPTSAPVSSAGTTTVQSGDNTYSAGPDGRVVVSDAQGNAEPFNATNPAHDVNAVEAILQQRQVEAAQADATIHPYLPNGAPVSSLKYPASISASTPDTPSVPSSPVINPDTHGHATDALKGIRDAITAQVQAEGGDLSKQAVNQRVEIIMRTDPQVSGIVSHLNDLQVKGALHNTQASLAAIHNPVVEPTAPPTLDTGASNVPGTQSQPAANQTTFPEGPGEISEPTGRARLGEQSPTWDAGAGAWRVGPRMGPEPVPFQGRLTELPPGPNLHDYQRRNIPVVDVGGTEVVAGPRPPYYSFQGREDRTGSPFLSTGPTNIAGDGFNIAAAHADASKFAAHGEGEVHALYTDTSKLVSFDGRKSRTYTHDEAKAFGFDTGGGSVAGNNLLKEIRDEYGASGMVRFLRAKGFTGVAFDLSSGSRPAWSVFDPRVFKNVVNTHDWTPDEIARREAFDPKPTGSTHLAESPAAAPKRLTKEDIDQRRAAAKEKADGLEKQSAGSVGKFPGGQEGPGGEPGGGSEPSQRGPATPGARQAGSTPEAHQAVSAEVAPKRLTKEDLDARRDALKIPEKLRDIPGIRTADDGTYIVPRSSLVLRPEQMQYKVTDENTELGKPLNAKGSTNSTAGVSAWNKTLAGTLDVWRDPKDGEVVVVNGHNRTDLGDRLGVGEHQVRFINADTPERARSIGALINIGEGRGTVLDAARFFRDSKLTISELAKEGINIQKGLTTEGMKLANLDGFLFENVLKGDFPGGVAGDPKQAMKFGAIVGDKLDAAQQGQLARILLRGKPISGAEALTNLINQIRIAPTVKTNGGGGFDFGMDPEEESIAVERANLAAYIDDGLKGDRSTFNVSPKLAKARVVAGVNPGGFDEDLAVSGKRDTTTAVAIFNKEKNLVGHISDLLNEHARRIAQGDTRASGEALDAVRSYLRSTFGGGQKGGPGSSQGDAEEAGLGLLEEPEKKTPGDGSQTGAASMDFILSPARAVTWALSKGVDVAKTLVEHIEGLRHEKANDFLENLDSHGAAFALQAHSNLDPFWVNQTQLRVVDGKAEANVGGEWSPVSHEELGPMLAIERAKEATQIHLVYAGVSPLEAYRQWQESRGEASKKAVGESIGWFERGMNLPTRISQGRSSTFGYVYEVLKRWDDQVNQHESNHAGARELMTEVPVKKAGDLMEYMMKARFKHNQKATDELREYHAQATKASEEKMTKAKALREQMDEYQRHIESLPDDDPNRDRWEREAKEGLGYAESLIKRLHKVIGYHRSEATDAEARGMMMTHDQMGKLGYDEQAIEAHDTYLGDFRSQMKEFERAARALAVTTSLDRMAKADEIRDKLTADGYPESLGKATATAQLLRLDQQIQDAQVVADKYKEIQLRERAYVPSIRDGEWVIRHTLAEPGDDGKDFVHVLSQTHGKTKSEVIKKADEWERLHPELKADGVVRTPILNWKSSDPATKPWGAASIEKAGRIANVSSDKLKELMDTLESLEMETSYGGGFKKHLRQAHGVLGYERDPVMAHARYTGTGAKYLAHLIHTPEFKSRIDELQKDAYVSGSKEVSYHKDEIIYLEHLAQDIFHNPVMGWVTQATNLASLSGLALKLSFVPQHAIMKLTHLLPTFSAIYGFKDAIKYQLVGTQIATAMALRGGDKPWEAITPTMLDGLGGDPEVRAKEIQGVIERASAGGLFADRVRHETARAAAGKDTEFSRKMDAAQKVAFSMVTAVINHNRRETFATQYLLARDLGYPMEKGLDTVLNADKLGDVKEGHVMEPLGSHAATVVAGKQVDWVNNRRGTTNRTQFQRAAGGLGMIPTQYKYFPIEYVLQMHEVYKMAFAQAKNEGHSDIGARMKAAAPVAASTGVILSMTGVAGLAFVSGIVDLFALLMNEFFGPAIQGSKFKPWRTLAGVMDDSMKKHGAPPWLREVVKHGLPSAFLGLSLERTMGYGHALQVRRGEGKDKAIVDLATGALGSLVQQGSKSLQSLVDHDWLGAAASMPGMPAGGRNLLNAIAEPQVNLGGGRIITKTPMDRAVMTTGITPSHVGQARAAAEEQNWATANAKERDTYFANALAQARQNGDNAKFRQILQDRADYNRDMMAQGRTEEISTGRQIKPTIRRDMGMTRKNQLFQKRLNE